MAFSQQKPTADQPVGQPGGSPHEKTDAEKPSKPRVEVRVPPELAAKRERAEKDEELDRLKQEAREAQERYLRTLAEFENTKKRLHREKDEFVRYASETMVRELLPIIDSLDQALVAVDRQADPQAIIKGVHLIYRQLLGLMEREGVKRIQTVGEPFDPHKHEAVAQVDAADGTADDTVAEEVQVGYTMHGKVIRPAMVKVAKKAAHPATPPGGSTPQTPPSAADPPSRVAEAHSKEHTPPQRMAGPPRRVAEADSKPSTTDTSSEEE